MKNQATPEVGDSVSGKDGSTLGEIATIHHRTEGGEGGTDSFHVSVKGADGAKRDYTVTQEGDGWVHDSGEE